MRNSYYYQDWKQEKSRLVIGNVCLESRKAKFGKEKCTYWKSEIRKFQIGNEKYPIWKLVMRKFKIGNWKC